MQQPTDEMVARFRSRTREHIARVAQNLRAVAGQFRYRDELLVRAETHDESKFGDAEFLPYVWLTEYYRCKNAGEPFAYPPGVAETVGLAVQAHYRANRHHPEYHEATKLMTSADIVEMVCDWTAMAQELTPASPTAKDWADRVIGTKYLFTPGQVRRIWQAIELLS